MNRKGEKDMGKYSVAIIFGGSSSEYGVSLESAHSVICNLDRERFDPVMIGISKRGDWFWFHGNVSKIREDTWCDSRVCVPAALSLDRRRKGLLLFPKEGSVHPTFRPGEARQDFIPIDAVLPVLHGKNGEDGTVQGLVELAGLPLAGCSVLASALCMDKDRAHRLVNAAGVRVPKAVTLKRGRAGEEALRAFAQETGYPLFVKPVKAGSSLGVTKVCRADQLMDAASLAFDYDDEIIVEENIPGFEVGCAVLGTDDLMTGEVDEIELAEGFFDFTEKYTLKTSAIHVPARISPQKAKEIKETAKRIYRALDCSVFARVDMFLTPEGEIVFNEVNTIPGFTEHSRYPGMMKAAGFSFQEILTKILKLALERKESERK